MKTESGLKYNRKGLEENTKSGDNYQILLTQVLLKNIGYNYIYFFSNIFG